MRSSRIRGLVLLVVVVVLLLLTMSHVRLPVLLRPARHCFATYPFHTPTRSLHEKCALSLHVSHQQGAAGNDGSAGGMDASEVCSNEVCIFQVAVDEQLTRDHIT